MKINTIKLTIMNRLCLLVFVTIIAISEVNGQWPSWMLGTYTNATGDQYQKIFQKDGSVTYRKKILMPVDAISGVYAANFAQGGSSKDGVDLYSGTNNVNVPLWTVSARGLELPISLSYSTKGIQVSQISSNVGLGWSLNAGGIIRRIVKGSPDDYCGDCGGGVNHSQAGWITDQRGECTMNLFTLLQSVSEEIYSWDPQNDEECLAHLLGYSQSLLSCGANLPNGNDDLHPNHDMESDVYIIDCPYVQGSFVFANEQTNDKIPIIRTLGQSNIRIIAHYDETGSWATIPIESFEVIDESGNIFYFDLIETFSMMLNSLNAENQFLTGAYAFSSNLAWEYSTGWFLTKIETYLGDEVDFSYEQEQYVADPSDVSFDRSVTNDPNLLPKKYRSKLLNQNWDVQNSDYITTYRLSEIAGPDFVVDFIAGTERTDLLNRDSYYNRCKRLDLINIYNKLSDNPSVVEFIRRIEFFYNYVDGGYCPSGNGPIYDDDLLTPANKRLLLTGVQESSRLQSFSPYKFTYNLNYIEDGSITGLPNRFDYSKDIWGYYNEASNSGLVPTLYVYPDRVYEYTFDQTLYSYKDRFWLLPLDLSHEVILSGADRLPNDDYTERGTLKTIEYPSGAKTEYQYEPNVFNYKGEAISGCGVRVKKKETKDQSNNVLNVENFSYDQGEALGFPIYGYFDPTISPQGLDEELYFKTVYVRGNVNMGNSNGEVGYGHVTVSTTESQNKGYVEYYFENTPTASIPISEVPSISYYSPSEITSIPEYIQVNPYETTYDYDADLQAESDKYPYHNKVNVDWFRGRTNSIIYKNFQGNPVKQINYTYIDMYDDGIQGLPDEIDKVVGMRVGFLQNSHIRNGLPLASVIKNVLYTGVASLPETVTTTLYDDNGNGLTETREYEYTIYNQLSRSVSYNSDGSKTVLTFKRPLDYFDVKGGSCTDPTDDNAKAILKLAQANSVNNIIEQTSRIINPSDDEFVTGGKISLYKWEVGYGTPPYVPKQDLYLATNTPIPIDPSATEPFEDSYCETGGAQTFQLDSRYKPIRNYVNYDYNYRLITSQNEENITSAYKWDYYLDKTLAIASNAMDDEIDYEGYELGRGSGTIVKSTVNNTAFAGDYMKKISANTTDNNTAVIECNSENAGYTASAWVKGSTEIKLKFEAIFASSQTIQKIVSNAGHGDEWFLLKTEFTNQELSIYADCEYLRVSIINEASQDAYVDEVKIYPSDALFTTKSYNDRLNLTAESNTNDIYVKFEYDDLDRLKLTRNFNDEIVSVKEYGSGNLALFSWWDSNGGTTVGTIPDVPEAGEEITISVNSPGQRGASYYYKIDGAQDYVWDDDGQFFVYLSQGEHSIEVKVSLDGYQDFTFERTLQVY